MSLKECHSKDRQKMHYQGLSLMLSLRMLPCRFGVPQRLSPGIVRRARVEYVRLCRDLQQEFLPLEMLAEDLGRNEHTQHEISRQCQETSYEEALSNQAE